MPPIPVSTPCSILPPNPLTSPLPTTFTPNSTGTDRAAAAALLESWASGGPRSQCWGGGRVEFESVSCAWWWDNLWGRELSPLLSQVHGAQYPFISGDYHCSPPPTSPPPRAAHPPPALERSARQLGVCQSACFPVTSKNISPATPPAAAISLPLPSEDQTLLVYPGRGPQRRSLVPDSSLAPGHR